jgi:hypothetical protein
VDNPCRSIDMTFDALRKLQATTVAGLNTALARAHLPELPGWTPPAAPACGAK